MQTSEHQSTQRTQYVPPRAVFGDEEEVVDMAARSAFTAWELALELNRHHPKLWKVIRGSPFEALYCQQFGERS